MADTRHPTLTSTFATRATMGVDTHPLTSYLLRLMDLKASNLCLSADVSNARELLLVADKVGPAIVVLKTHYDLIAGWDFHPQTGTGAKLVTLARKHGFLIFEDRKFGDIGSTVQQQYVGGSARVVEWAHITNVNMIPGPTIVTALAEAAAKWKERINYEVKTSVSAGFSYPEDGEGTEEGGCVNPRTDVNTSNHLRDADERKGSIVSITTVTQSFEPADSPRLSKTTLRDGDEVYLGIEEAPTDRGLLILAQMSSAGNLMNAEYTNACLDTARKNKGFVMGFVAQQSLNGEPEDNFITMTPGCQLPPEDEPTENGINGDGLGQQYKTPEKLIVGSGCDIIIVGRGILKADNPQLEAERYRKAAWKAYTTRMN
ncbi:orotidine 5'-phosphate decarboxylase [Zalerion maritima]|uniref:Orotidine 5'-phosphate decarboxylase n=1 Tax=Zalerion maritima TaxID=339359 RepID=A0AAD5RGQ5_9PEZI|nr:orotidine 5'-phosphate decarboxylase [Zalerion maritima]